MRRIRTIEGISIMYLVYFTITLYFTPRLFVAEQSDLYDALELVAPNQDTWEIIGILLIIIYCVSFFLKHWMSRVVANFVGGSFFMLICVTYMFTYPNIGGGIFLFISIYCFKEVYIASNDHEDSKVAMQKKKLEQLEKECDRNNNR
ncbi:hypothetical protein [Staphylococcus simulans]|uniref:hypothetical protein n=1 Tax=Staphylococcus simulans TaxID=1286 RepID=UPI000D1DA621|nr:hypothetical protein [Staphylococcus simulans]PTJ91630.1 hypothetical protein BU032_04730 [Staphylococcus simulans]